MVCPTSPREASKGWVILLMSVACWTSVHIMNGHRVWTSHMLLVGSSRICFGNVGSRFTTSSLAYRVVWFVRM